MADTSDKTAEHHRLWMAAERVLRLNETECSNGCWDKAIEALSNAVHPRSPATVTQEDDDVVF